jgi:hypothetical protein
MDTIKKGLGKRPATENGTQEAIPSKGSEAQETAMKGYTVENEPSVAKPVNPAQEHDNLRIPIDGKTVEIKDQIHMYTTNQLLSHPLVSPVLQPSLGGLPPLQILSGGGEMLRDEQFYVAHKASNPSAYAPSDVYLDEFDPKREVLHKYSGTHVQLQVWDDLCHVATTLSFTHPAKYMYRSIAQFGAWALACAQETEIDILDDTEISPVSSDSSDGPAIHSNNAQKQNSTSSVASVGKAGDALPPFKEHMIRQRVDKRGHIYPLDPPSSYDVLQIPSSRVGTINPELVKRWIARKMEWDTKYAKDKLHVQRQRVKELAYCFQQDFVGEVPPPSSLAARKSAPGVLPSRSIRKSYPMMMWSNWASRHDERSIQREYQKEKEGQSRRTSVEAGRAGACLKARETDKAAALSKNKRKGTIATNEQPVSPIGQRSITIDSERTNQGAIDEAKSKSSSDTQTEETASRKLEGDTKSFSPMILLPGYDERKFKEENASTQALFHARGTIPSASDLATYRSKQRPVSQAGSGTIRSGITSAEVGDDTSTLGDRSLAVTNIGVDAASTRAVRHSVGVVDLINDGDSAHRSLDFYSMPRDSGDLETASSIYARTDGDISRTVSRPGLGDREIYKSAQEYPVD